MPRRIGSVLLAGAAVALMATPAVAATNVSSNSVSFQVIGDLPVPGWLAFDGATFGGLSGVDYDSGTGTWRAISNDGSNHGPARFYTLNLGTSGTALHNTVSAQTTTAASISGSLVPLLRADGTPYPPSSGAGQDTVEPEAIRFDPTSNTVLWANEGVNNSSLVVDPSIRQSTTDGHLDGQFPTARQMANGSPTQGIRDGEGFTGLTVSANGLIAFSTLAGSLVQDGPDPTATTGALTRIVGHSRTLAWKPLAEYAYPLDKLPLTDANGNGTNQVADILTVDATHYLVLERGTAPGMGNSVRLYEIDTTGAFNVAFVPSLSGGTFAPVTKTLLLDFASLNLPGGVANFSGLTWGPTLSNGDRSLVLVSDNGFNSGTATQILALDAHGI